MSIQLRAAMASRESVPTRVVMTPRRPLKLTRADGGTEVLMPGQDLVVPGHELVRMKPDAWRRIHHPMTPRGREQPALEAELRHIQRQRRELEARGRQSAAPSRSARPWRLTASARSAD